MFPFFVAGKMNNQNTFEKVLARLQNAEIVEDEEDFLLLSSEDVAASEDEQRQSCFGKLISDRELNIHSLRRCLCRAWRRSEFKICKLDTCTYHFYFQELESVMSIISGGPWNVEDYLLVLQPWQENLPQHSNHFFFVDF